MLGADLEFEAYRLLKQQHFDCLAVGVIDFAASNFACFEIREYENISTTPSLYFDLASLTKPLTLNTSILSLMDQNQKIPPFMYLLLNHQGGLPSGGRLSSKNWKEQVLSYPLPDKAHPTLYSDYSALRLQLELEKFTGLSLKELCSPYWDEGIHFWKDLPKDAPSPITGQRFGKAIQGLVHDDNAYNIAAFCSHAGLFAKIDSLCKTLIKINKSLNLLPKLKYDFINNNSSERFRLGMDTVTDPANTLAGSGCSKMTFGHLGFTGTSFWIDIEKQRGHVILTNATKNYWYDRAGLTELRKTLGTLIWKGIL